MRARKHTPADTWRKDSPRKRDVADAARRRAVAVPATQQLDLSPYTGRWVAIVRGRVAGVGLTEREARLAARRNRPKEEPSAVIFVSEEKSDAE